MSATTTPPRLRQVHGAWLLAQDFRDGPRLPARRSAQHVVAAHRTWGVSAGLDVRVAGGRVLVGPGCAVDRCGRTGILAAACATPLVAGQEVAVVLCLRGDGPRAQVRLRGRGQVRDLDVPLATVDAAGVVRDGDGDRQWLRRPGPVLVLGGTVGRGAPAGPIWPLQQGRVTGWTTHVDLRARRLAGVPAVVAGLVGPPAPSAGHTFPSGARWPAPVQDTTVEVDDVTADGFDLVVRRHVAADGLPAGELVDHAEPDQTLTTPFALSWLAVLPAERPAVPHPEESP